MEFFKAKRTDLFLKEFLYEPNSCHSSNRREFTISLEVNLKHL